MPLFSVIVPVYNRQGELRRALQSVAAQTVADFECLVVDDGSTTPVDGVVDEFDERFSLLRRENGGCTAARLTGFGRSQGDFIISLDSDNELLPWALDRAAHYLGEYPEADAATGLQLFPDGLRIRVGGGVKVEGPEDYAARTPSFAGRSDMVAVHRRRVIKEWQALRSDYYNLDFVLAMRFRLTHRVVLVDEPWGRYDPTSTDKIASRRDPRGLDDVLKFVEDFRPLVGTWPCGPVDQVLTNLWVRLIKARRYGDAAVLADWMHERGITYPQIISRKLKWRLRTRVTRVIPARAHIF